VAWLCEPVGLVPLSVICLIHRSTRARTKSQLTAFRSIRFVSVPDTECMHHRMLLLRFHMLAVFQLSPIFYLLRSSVTTSTSIIGVLSRVWVPNIRGNCRSAHHGFTTSISISIRGVFSGFSFCFFFGKGNIKKRAVSAATLWRHGSRIDGFSKHHFHNCSLFFSFHVQKLFSMLLLYCHAVNSGWLC